MADLHVTLETGMRAARHDWDSDPRLIPALLAMVHDQAGKLPVQLNAVGTIGSLGGEHFQTCPDTGIAHIAQDQYPDDDGCRINSLRTLLTCPHASGWADYAEYGDLTRLLAFIESRSWPVGPWLTSADPEPAPDSSVIGKDGRTWIRFADMAEDGAANWEAWEVEGDVQVRESWVQVAGEHGPVRRLNDEGVLRD